MLYLGWQNQAIFAWHTIDFCRQIKSADFVVRLTSPSDWPTDWLTDQSIDPVCLMDLPTDPPMELTWVSWLVDLLFLASGWLVDWLSRPLRADECLPVLTHRSVIDTAGRSADDTDEHRKKHSRKVSLTAATAYHFVLFSLSLFCRHRQCLASRGHSVAPWWPRLTAHLQRSAGWRLLSRRIWSTHLLRGWLGRGLYWLLGGRPSDRSPCQLSDLWAGMSSFNLATWPKRELSWWPIDSEIDSRPVDFVMLFQINWCHLIRRSSPWHFIWNASRALELASRRVQVSAICSNTDSANAW